MAGVTMGGCRVRSGKLWFEKPFNTRPLAGFAVLCSAVKFGILVCAFIAGLRLVAASDVPAPTAKITGPILATTPLRGPEHGYPFNATPMDLAKHGYVEEEFFLSGRGSIYEILPGSSGMAKESNLPFKTRS